MTTVNNLSTQQINAALLSLRNERAQAQRPAEKETKSSSNNSRTSVNVKLSGTDPIKVSGTNISIDTSGTWEGTATNAINDGNGNNIKDTYINNEEKGKSQGVATLDENSRIPYSQLPESAMEFKGTWNAELNEPRLENGTGTNGDFYVVSEGGYQFGEIFYINDRIIYDGSTNTWVKLSGIRYLYGTPIGSITQSVINISNDGWLLCDGTMYSSDDYPELAKILDKEETGVFTVPNLIGRFLEGSNEEESNSYVKAGLPGIKGNIGLVQGRTWNEGAFRSFGNVDNSLWNAGATACRASFHADYGETYANGEYKTSEEDKVYGRSDTVQPPAYKLMFFIKAKNSTYRYTEEDVIDDNETNFTQTWSSGKIDGELNILNEEVEDTKQLIPTYEMLDVSGLDVPVKYYAGSGSTASTGKTILRKVGYVIHTPLYNEYHISVKLQFTSNAYYKKSHVIWLDHIPFEIKGKNDWYVIGGTGTENTATPTAGLEFSYAENTDETYQSIVMDFYNRNESTTWTKPKFNIELIKREFIVPLPQLLSED